MKILKKLLCISSFHLEWLINNFILRKHSIGRRRPTQFPVERQFVLLSFDWNSILTFQLLWWLNEQSLSIYTILPNLKYLLCSLRCCKPVVLHLMTPGSQIFSFSSQSFNLSSFFYKYFKDFDCTYFFLSSDGNTSGVLLALFCQFKFLNNAHLAKYLSIFMELVRTMFEENIFR